MISATARTYPLREAFRTAHRRTTEVTVARVRVEFDGLSGYGESGSLGNEGGRPRDVVAFLERHGEAIVGDDPYDWQAVHRRFTAAGGPSEALMGLDGALLDWLGRTAGLPVHRLLGVADRTPRTSYTISLDSAEAMVERARRAPAGTTLKVKMDASADLTGLTAIRAATGRRLQVDCNGSWDLPTTVRLLPRLAELGVEVLEQPLPADDRAGYAALRDQPRAVPVYVDESCRGLADLAGVAALADGVNIKLAKCGGTREALRMISAARALGLGILLGCTIETQRGIAQAAAVAPLCDFADLDGHLLIDRDTVTGLGFRDGRIVSSPDPGFGLHGD